MTMLDWASAPRVWEQGVDRGVLYFEDEAHVWNGLESVDEKPSATQDASLYLDGVRLAVTEDIEDFAASVNAYTYPKILDGQSPYTRYGISYRTTKSDGYLLHIVYNAILKPPARSWDSLARVITASMFQWDLQASAVIIPGARPSSHIVIDSAAAAPELVAMVEGWLYGTVDTDPYLPTPEDVVDLFEALTTLRITVNGDGTWTATGPDEILAVNPDGSFDISAPTAQFLETYLFTVSSF